MILIAHRGNTNGKCLERENTEEYILEAINQEYYVEVDVWLIDNNLYLGHDYPQYLTTLNFLKNDKIICHAKNIDVLQFLLNENIHCFSHNVDEAVITSKGYIWLYPGLNICKKGIIVMPEWKSIKYDDNWLNYVVKQDCYGVCSDYVNLIKNYNI